VTPPSARLGSAGGLAAAPLDDADPELAPALAVPPAPVPAEPLAPTPEPAPIAPTATGEPATEALLSLGEATEPTSPLHPANTVAATLVIASHFMRRRP
jgi:hypothetical protein